MCMPPSRMRILRDGSAVARRDAIKHPAVPPEGPQVDINEGEVLLGDRRTSSKDYIVLLGVCHGKNGKWGTLIEKAKSDRHKDQLVR